MVRGECQEQRPDCPFRGTEACMVSTHHEYYPKHDYTDTVSKLFRNLIENTVQLRWCDHSDLHATQEPPEKPPREEMIEAIAKSGVFLSARKRKELGL